MARASVGASRGGTSRPIPVRVTGSRTPGRLLATTGVPQSMLSTWTMPKLSVWLMLGSTGTAPAAKHEAMSSVLSSPVNTTGGSHAASAGSRRRRYARSPTTCTWSPVMIKRTGPARRSTSGSAASRYSTPFSDASRAASTTWVLQGRQAGRRASVVGRRRQHAAGCVRGAIESRAAGALEQARDLA